MDSELTTSTHTHENRAVLMHHDGPSDAELLEATPQQRLIRSFRGSCSIRSSVSYCPRRSASYGRPPVVVRWFVRANA